MTESEIVNAWLVERFGSLAAVPIGDHFVPVRGQVLWVAWLIRKHAVAAICGR